MKKASITVLACALIGCASVSDIEGEQGSRFTERVGTPPATTYRNLVTQARDCYANTAFRVHSEFFPDISAGNVRVENLDGSTGLLNIKLTPHESGGTSMLVAYWDAFKMKGAEADWRRSVVPWANGEKGYCAADLFKPRPRPDPSRQ